jgi:hypothetical protein
VLATHDASGNVHACVNRYTGQARIMLPGRPPNCATGEVPVEWPGTGVATDLAALQAEMTTLQAVTAALQTQVPDCLSTEGSDAVFEGCNVHVRNGLDGTETINGLGNLIVGYNEESSIIGDSRGGSHNLVVGSQHGYSSFGGFVAGFENHISGGYASVSGGEGNWASGDYSSMSGGNSNTASGAPASISGGNSNTASGNASSVSGGFGNIASGDYASVSGGNGRTAAGLDDWVAGGLFQDN